jgi:hypothetical protein
MSLRLSENQFQAFPSWFDDLPSGIPDDFLGDPLSFEDGPECSVPSCCGQMSIIFSLTPKQLEALPPGENLRDRFFKVLGL